MEAQYLWTERPDSAPTGEGTLSAYGNDFDLGSDALKQLVRKRGHLNVGPITTRVGIDGSDNLQMYQPAKDRIVQALKDRQQICVFMDFDCDGQTAGSCMVHTLSKLTDQPVLWIVGNRLTEGHGIAVQRIIQSVPKGALIITVDTGISNREAVKQLKEFGYDVLITDHHLQEGHLPACMVLDPKLILKEGDPEYMAPGVYVSAKLALLVAAELLGGKNNSEYQDLWHFCACLTGIGIVSDVIELHPDMRRQLQVSLAELSITTHAGLLALLQVSSYRPNQGVTASFLSYNVIPKINSAGRMGKAEEGVKVFLLEEDNSGYGLDSQLAVTTLKGLNDTRKTIEQAVYLEAVDQAEEYVKTHPTSLVVYGPHWHVGVIGIVAARLAEQYGRSTLVLGKVTEPQEMLAASGRTVDERDLFREVGNCSELLLGFGGHKAACGCQLLPENLEAFKDAFEKSCAEYGKNIPLEHLVDADVTIYDLYDPQFQIWCMNIEPYGNLNPPLIFKLSNVRVHSVDEQKEVLKFVLKTEDNEGLIVSKYRAPSRWASYQGAMVDVLLTPSYLYFTCSVQVEWRLVDIRDHETEEEE